MVAGQSLTGVLELCVELTEGTPVFVLQLPPLAEAGFGRRLLLHSALVGHLGGTLRAEVGGHVAR